MFNSEKNYTPPNIGRTSFHCPYCATKAPQRWLQCYGKDVDSENRLPQLWNVKAAEELINNVKKDSQFNGDIFELGKAWLRQAHESESGDFILEEVSDSKYCNLVFSNIYFSVCQEVGCGKAALWVHDKLVIPSTNIEEEPNYDMPEKVKAVYNEARDVHKVSPRASAALLRLCCELLCEELKAQGNNLNEKIGFLVSQGMDARIQKALDILRFIGNDAVHPGQIDLKDDMAISHSLFVLINEIVQEMISKPKRLQQIYTEKLPEGVRNAIKRRDAKATV